ncbi:four-carbon acid sugar kinase family protein [Domibacillus sp. PGB-M46]|uniref:four-carbon acid sugar kinase family protein n=1 Tax=Domibacillus sp. PGB-M46 TaxID=2910255 RepID=UPI001F57AE01|nr:four-carbon acid sugar kinase family protein [Domibacillus sp. PGB-M46]MCI2256530.1 four-carbon acid sugar kinase family protein [Domibacillus sp. PGB-M46]
MRNMIGVVADDTTGANDIGIMFSKNDWTVKVVAFSNEMDLQQDANVVIIDTDSRLDAPDLSYQKVYAATKALKDLPCTQFFNKTCSVFRGNIGKEFDAMLDALNEEFAVIVLSFPKNGRRTVNGIHTVHGKRLEDSEFAHDPVHPMNQSSLVSILQEQTDRKVTAIHLDTVRQGAQVLKNEIDKQKEAFNYCIIDAETQADLTIVAEAVKDIKVLCGSSALGEELPKFLPAEDLESPLQTMDMKDDNGVLVVSGSLTPQTREQTSLLMQNGCPSVVIDSRAVFLAEERQAELEKALKKTIEKLKSGQDVLLMANNSPEIVQQTKDLGLEAHIDSLTISKMVSALLADITVQAVDALDLKRLVIAGGDTSGTISRKLGIKGNFILDEIATGVPSGLAFGRDMLIVLKSGSFGEPDFLIKAVEHLKDLTLQKK